MDNRTTIQVSEKLRKELRTLAANRDISYQQLIQDMIEIFKELDREKTLVSIPKKLADKTNQKIKNTEFESLSEFLTFLTRLYLSEKEPIQEESDMDERVKKKLERLGYI